VLLFPAERLELTPLQPQFVGSSRVMERITNMSFLMPAQGAGYGNMQSGLENSLNPTMQDAAIQLRPYCIILDMHLGWK